MKGQLNKFNKKFSFPINYQEIFINKTIDINWFIQYSSLINEVYITPDFMGLNIPDMNGPNLIQDSELIINFLKKLKINGIKICVIFNNIFELNDNHLEKLLKKLTEFDIDILVVPNIKWLKRIRAEFPNILIKNTVINLPTINEIESGEYDDYDMIYVHDEIIHNHDYFLSIKNDRKFGTVVNYLDCATNCRFKERHYKLINDGKYDANLFCKTANMDPIELKLKRNNIPFFKSEFEYYLDVIDIYKLQGRNNTGTFNISVEIIENIYNNKELLIKNYSTLINELGPINFYNWKIKVRNCTGECDTCNFCDNILKEIK